MPWPRALPCPNQSRNEEPARGHSCPQQGWNREINLQRPTVSVLRNAAADWNVDWNVPAPLP